MIFASNFRSCAERSMRQFKSEDTLTTARVILVGLSRRLHWLHQLISLTLSPANHLLSPSVCQPVPSPLDSLQPCRRFWKSFSPIRHCKYVFAQCLSRTSQTENPCPESVLSSSSKNKQQPERRASPLNIPSHIKVPNGI